MLLTIATTHRPATDLGFLLHKHPDRAQSFDLPVGRAHVLYPEATDERCTAALLLEVDPIGLVRGKGGPTQEGFTLGRYVNDRPYASSSLLAIALKNVFRTALTGRCDARPELAAGPLPLVLRVPAVRCRGGADLLIRLFEPLGWTVAATAAPLDPQIPQWGASPYLDVTLTGELRLADALNHLYVLLPVLDDAKHYWVSDDEVDKLVRAGGGWLAGHPDRELITGRYLAHSRELTRSALERLADVDDGAGVDDVDDAPEDEPRLPEERRVSLREQRIGAVMAAVRRSGAGSVGDLGCGEGALLAELVADRSIARVVGTDVSVRALTGAARRLRLDRMAEPQRARVELFQSALTYRDERLAGLDAAVLMEVIEHVDPPRLAALERTVFGFAAPGTVVVTTPNAEYNVRWDELPAGTVRHRDHRFEWTRGQFAGWAEAVGATYGYTVRYGPVGPVDDEVGPPTQMAIFTRVAR